MNFIGIGVEPCEVYAYRQPDGIEYMFNVTEMWRAAVRAMKHREPGDPLDFDYIKANMDPVWIEHVRLACGIEADHLDLVDPGECPLILAVHARDGETIQVDGHHRLIKLFERGDQTYNMLRWKYGTWARFLVSEDMVVGEVPRA